MGRPFSYRRIIICLILSIGLSGCIPAAFVVGAAAGGSVIYDKRSFKTMAKDRHIEQTAENTFIEDSEFSKGHAHISVAVFNGVVLMVGQAPTPELRDRAYQWMTQIKYIRRIYNQIEIRKSISKMQISQDAWITTEVKTAMLFKSGLQSSQIKVVTEDGVVYLMGIVSRKQALLASEVARRVKGVQKVIEVFEYIQ